MQLSLLALYVRILSLSSLHLILSTPENGHLSLKRFDSGLIVLFRLLDYTAPILIGDPQLAHPFLLCLINLFQLFILSLIRADGLEER